MNKTVVCSQVEDTEKIGTEIAEYAQKEGYTFIALYGDLGVGKTALVRGFVAFYGDSHNVMSPTYNLVNVYGDIYHFDMYRISDEDDLYSIGFYDYDDGKNIIITEWSENIEYALPDRYLRVTIKKTENHENERVIEIKTVGK
ncbi:MAG: tRNA (adenosine(37)-N6)-threonylcarbamoyltransferase complex ATPase subunit type 1 TsaE [Clostridia bacterium]|nr:tRNA (adenosine(37)-N6)-threonylcarbamoyltransferase complex ATPase subunit type 1 TsaE [Clostridia bacterium]